MTTTNDGANGQALHPILDLNADKARAYVADAALEDLDGIEAAEIGNPKQDGGRVSVLKAIADRRAKLADSGPIIETNRPDDDAFDIVPESSGKQTPDAIDLLLVACERFGVHPGIDRRPQELAAWRYEGANRLDGIPAAVTIVTKGGVKLKLFADDRYPMDQETDEKLHLIFNAFRIDKDTKLQIPVDLPGVQTLPDSAVTGQVASQRHRYEGGYLRNGGKVAAARRAK